MIVIVEKARLALLEPFAFERVHMAEAVTCLGNTGNAAVNLEMFSIVSMFDMPWKERFRVPSLSGLDRERVAVLWGREDFGVSQGPC